MSSWDNKERPPVPEQEKDDSQHGEQGGGCGAGLRQVCWP